VIFVSEILFEKTSFPSADGKTSVAAYFWRSETVKPRAILQLSHGMCEYITRYDAWARRFVEAGYVFCGNDHLGHGDSAPCAEELGFMAPRGGAELLVEDVHQMTLLAKEKFPDLPLVLYGHSMGSFVARAYLTRYGEELAGALISGTAGPGQPTGMGRMMAHTVEKMYGDHHRSKLLTAVAFGSYNKKFSKEGSMFSWLTRDESVRERYANDPFCTFVFTAAGYDTLFSLLGEVSDKKWAHGVPKTLPVLLFSGDMDPVGAYGKGVRKVYDRLLRAGCNVQLQLYEGGRHEMHNEINKDEVFDDLIRYLEEILR
jgi:alpha-beta hydrolase superfamily lysophospholipase